MYSPGLLCNGTCNKLFYSTMPPSRHRLVVPLFERREALTIRIFSRVRYLSMTSGLKIIFHSQCFSNMYHIAFYYRCESRNLSCFKSK